MDTPRRSFFGYSPQYEPEKAMTYHDPPDPPLKHKPFPYPPPAFVEQPQKPGYSSAPLSHFKWYQEPFPINYKSLPDLCVSLRHWRNNRNFNKDEVYAYLKTVWHGLRHNDCWEEADVVEYYGTYWYSKNSKEQYEAICYVLQRIEEILQRKQERERKDAEYTRWRLTGMK